MATLAEYIWIDGVKPVPTLRSKSRVINIKGEAKLSDFPEWSFDGSSTSQAEGHFSDLALVPVTFISDPLRGQGNYLVMCEVFNPDGTEHWSNTRAQLRRTLEAGADKEEAMVGFEQEYTLFDGDEALGFADGRKRGPQGPYYCGVGADRVFGRELVEAHTQACLEAGLMVYGINAEVMPGQWEFQVGYRGFDGDKNDVLTCTDHLWLAGWLLHRLGEEFGIRVSFENKPKKGDWNGAGCHTNISTKAMRETGGIDVIHAAVKRLEAKHTQHIAIYGDKNDERLTGAHETCSVNEFRSGVSDRGASIRIPLGVNKKGYGYLEDRRPGANADPYLVVARLLTTICDLPEDTFSHGNDNNAAG